MARATAARSGEPPHTTAIIILRMQVTFVLIDSEPLERLRELQPDRDWQGFVDGERAWILQTYLRLRAAGCPVVLSRDLPVEGIAVFSSKQRRILRSRRPSGCNAVLVGVREDVGEALIADFEVVQNRHQSDASRRFFIPFWPQPALIPRDAGRGVRVENLAFKGFVGNLHADFRSEEWHRFLDAHRLRWLADAVPYVKHALDVGSLAWNDYREVDLVLAVRPPARAPHPRKPATKLYNAWHAGVPALLGPEIAYRELRRSPLDYLEVTDRSDAQAAIQRLLADPGLYQAMIDHGQQRAGEFGVPNIVALWSDLLFKVIPAQAEAEHVLRWRGQSLWKKEIVRRLVRATGLRR